MSGGNPMRFADYLILEGGNVEAINKLGHSKYADKIDLRKFKITDFRNEFYNLFKELNKKYKAKFKEPLWANETILKNGVAFNGSTSYIMNPELDPEEILKHKTHAGDLDIMIPKETMTNLWDLLHSLEGKKIGNFTYFGNNRPNRDATGTQINSLFIYHHKEGDISCQIDFEASEFENHQPTDWARFSHGSSFEDAQVGIKALHHKLLLRAMVGAMSANPNIVIATPASTAEKVTLKKSTEVPRMQQFSVDRGLGFGLEPLLDKNGNIVVMNGKQVYKEKKGDANRYVQDLGEIFQHIFKTKENMSKFHSFVGIIELIKKHCDKKTIADTHKRYFEILFGKSAQVIESFSPEDDAQVKLAGFNYFLKHLGLKHPTLNKDVEAYYELKKSAFRQR